MDCTTLVLRLLLAHLLADFYLQPARWIEDRRKRGAGCPWLYAHGLLHGLLAWAALGAVAHWPWAAAIALSHVLIDLVKSRRDQQGKSAAWFLIDQCLHVSVLLAATHFVAADGLTVPDKSIAATTKILAVVVTALAIVRPVGFFIQAFASRWEQDLGDRTDNLPGAGKWIGVIERLLVLLFVQIDSMEAVGFLLAAKSVFRFGDMRDSTDRKRTEYVLVGTLFSFGIAAFMAVALFRLLRGGWS